MTNDSNLHAIVDQEHLKLLSLFYWVSAGINAFYSLIGLVYVFFAIVMFQAFSKMPNNGHANDGPPPALFGWLFGGVGLMIFLFLMAMAALKARAGFCIKARKSRTLCLVAAGFSCLEIPYGSLLGVFTFVVLDRPSVRNEFAQPPAQ